MLFKYFINTNAEQMLKITNYINDALRQSKAVEGICVVFCPHTTAGITINESVDPDVMRDFLLAFELQVPDRPEFRHIEGNSAAHIKASLVGSSATIPIVNGQLDLGVWQDVYFCEFDGPRSRKFSVTIISALQEEKDMNATQQNQDESLPYNIAERDNAFYDNH